MTGSAFHLSEEQTRELPLRYRGMTVDFLSYGTVSDFCDSRDYLPNLSRVQSDLKDLQRPRAVKLVLTLCPPGGSIVEVGGGDPYVAQVLAELGYDVTVVDPYDGTGRGPTEFERYQREYPQVRFVRGYFSDSIQLSRDSYDCIYSISVLEHVHQPKLNALFKGVQRYLKKGGTSAHLIDCVVAGEGADFHLAQVAEIIGMQGELSRRPRPELLVRFAKLLTQASLDVETFYLSPEGHDLWRGKLAYKDFPFRKVISVESFERRAED